MIESFEGLYFEVIAKSGRGHGALTDVLFRATSDGIGALMEPLQRYRRRNSERHRYEVDVAHLWEWYALGRANEALLLGFQPPPSWTVGDDPFDLHERRSNLASERSLPDDVPTLSEEDYLWFFAGLSFEAFRFDAFRGNTFSPFHHEIVDVRVVEGAGTDVAVEHVYWPGLRFGELLFSRAGVGVACSPSALVKGIAERSTLYFAHRRRRRPTQDPSVGWGSNSQWRTAFRRDYEDTGQFYFNVDGTIDVGAGSAPRMADDYRGPDPNEGLPLDVRRELLVHRCLVRSAVDDGDLWPYRDRLTVPTSSGRPQ